jgi:hypothetical protein
MKFRSSLFCATLIAMSAVPRGYAGIVVEGFDDISLLPGLGWSAVNQSNPTGSTSWFQGIGAEFSAHDGGSSAYIAANYNNVDGVGTISDWLIMPSFIFANGDSLTFYTRTVDTPTYADGLQVRFSANGASTNVGATENSVGDFTTLLLEINPTLTTSGYPSAWTEHTVSLSGLAGNVAGRLAFRYFVTNAGSDGDNGDYIGIDSVRFDVASVPEPGSMALMGAGLIALGAQVRKRRRAR